MQRDLNTTLTDEECRVYTLSTTVTSQTFDTTSLILTSLFGLHFCLARHDEISVFYKISLLH